MRYVDGLPVYWKDDNTILLQGGAGGGGGGLQPLPRAFRFADLWNAQTIASGRE